MISQDTGRKTLAQFEKDFQMDYHNAANAEVENRARQSRSELERAVKIALDQYSKIKYYGADHPEIVSLKPDDRGAEKRKLNRPAAGVIAALVYCQKNPRVTGEDLKRLKPTVFKNFPPHLDITFIPLLAMYGKTFARLVEIQKDLHNDGDEEIPDALIPGVRQRTMADDSPGGI